MKNIHVLPTDNSSRLSIKDSVLILHRLQWRKGTQNIYITSYSEEIKEGDWIITKGKLVKLSCMSYDMVKGSKVILTTDQDLIKDGIQAIDDEFLEWFVKNPSCERVYTSVVKTRPRGSNDEWEVTYGINIQKEEPSTKLHIGEAKQETLEEVAKRLYPENWESIMDGQHDSNSYERTAFIAGAKWQQEQDKNKYSEEELLHFADFYHKYKEFIKEEKWEIIEMSKEEVFKKWFEQFKNK